MRGAVKGSEVLSIMEPPVEDTCQVEDQEINLDIQDAGDTTAVRVLKKLPLGGMETSPGMMPF